MATQLPNLFLFHHLTPPKKMMVSYPGFTDHPHILYVVLTGVLLSPLVSTSAEKPCMLVVMDAKSFTEIARAFTHTWTPFTFHGIFAGGY
jgi:hypothetical protein